MATRSILTRRSRHRDDQYFRNSVMLAERLEVPVIVGFSGCPQVRRFG